MASATEVPTPIGVFWDIENCSVPKWRSALLVVQRIREKFFTGHREVEFMCVCDTTKENKFVIKELNSAQINVVHIDSVSKNAADDKLRQNIRRFSDTHSAPAAILLISSDVNFAGDLSDLRHRKNLKVILVHKRQTNEALILCATEHFLYEDLIKDVPARTPSKCSDGKLEIQITGFPRNVDEGRLKVKLQHLSNNCGGRVVSITQDYALVKFSSHTTADRARGRMDGEEVFGEKIRADFSMKPHSSPGHSDRQGSNSPQQLFNNRNQLKSPSPKRNNNANEVGQSNFNSDYSQHRFSMTSPSVGETTQPNYMSKKTLLLRKDSEKPELDDDRVLRQQPEELISNDEVCTTEEYVEKEQMKGLVKKFSQEKKSSRQLLMLQQQMYQEDQPPYFNPNHSTQFYSHYTKYQESAYSNHSYSNHQWQQNTTGYYDNQQHYQGYNNNCRNSYPPRNQYGSNSIQGGYSDQTFCPIRPSSPANSIPSTSPTDLDPDVQAELDFPDSVELVVSNLDYNISPREWKHILMTTFQPQVRILYINVQLQPDNTSLGTIRVATIGEARFAISQFHRKKIGYKRIHVTLRNEDGLKTCIRTEAIALLQEAKGNVLPLFKFIELFDKRYHQTISVSELYKMRDVIEIREQQGAGRMVYLVPSPETTPTPQDVSDMEVQEIMEQSLCPIHCPEGSTMYAEVMNCSILPNVHIQLKTFAPQVHSLLMLHDGDMPLMSFPACFSVETAPLSWVLEGGVPLEHLISCVPGIQILISKTGVKKVSWAENKPPASVGEEIESGRQCNSPLLNQQLTQISRDMIDLLKHSPGCRMSFGKFIPSYHHHFGRQCRVADYGYSKLMELFEAIPHVLQILGTGDRRVLTLTHKAQIKRFTGDVVRLLKTIPGKQLAVSGLSDAFYKLNNKEWDISDYGVCCLEDMLNEIPASTLNVVTDGVETYVSLPRRDQTMEELERTKLFSLEVVDLLKHNHQCRMLFNKFIPAYHHHFGRQCRVSDYGFNKLLDLFESIPHIVELVDELEEKVIKLTESELRKVVGEQIVNLLKSKKMHCLPLESLMMTFTLHYGFPLPLIDFNVQSAEELVNKLKHVLKVEQYDNKEYIVLSDRTSAPPLALQVLQLLMDQSGGSLPLMELCSRYNTKFGVEPDIRKIKEELLDYVQVSGDDESGVISLTPLQTLARDIRILLQSNGKVSLSEFEQLCNSQFGVEIKPALYGFPTTVALLMAIPHVVSIKGKGYRRMVHLSGDLQGALPIIDECYTRPDSDTPSNDSGSALTDDDQSCGGVAEFRKRSPYDLLGGLVPSNIPSPDLTPEMLALQRDLITLELRQSGDTDQIWNMSDAERRQQMTPLCETPTSELLKLAAQCLPPRNTADGKPPTPEHSGTPAVADDILSQLKNGWWSASASQLHEVSKSIETYWFNKEVMLQNEGSQSDPSRQSDSQSQVTTYTEKLPFEQGYYGSEESTLNDGEESAETGEFTYKSESKQVKQSTDKDTTSPLSGEVVGMKPLYTEILKRKPDISPDSNEMQMTEMNETKLQQSTERPSVKLLKGKLDTNTMAEVLVKLRYSGKSEAEKRSPHNCTTSDCMCYDTEFRQDQPLDTSSVKSDTSFGESPHQSPDKMSANKLDVTEVKEGISPECRSPRKMRMAAKFCQPIILQ